jgi:hypothetical protein
MFSGIFVEKIILSHMLLHLMVNYFPDYLPLVGQSPKGGCAHGAVPTRRSRQRVGGRHHGSRCPLPQTVGRK